jgi:hypothetical protein
MLQGVLCASTLSACRHRSPGVPNRGTKKDRSPLKDLGPVPRLLGEPFDSVVNVAVLFLVRLAVLFELILIQLLRSMLSSLLPDRVGGDHESDPGLEPAETSPPCWSQPPLQVVEIPLPAGRLG